MKVLTDNQHYQDIAEAILAKTGGTTPLKPAEMAPALNDLNIELEEAYVTPTSEPQEILPGPGFYGFSKIYVNAAPESGGSGGGTGGGDSGGDSGGGTDYPSAEDTSFGNEYIEGEIPTGMCLYYTTESDTTPTKAPALPAGGYGIMFAYNSDGKNIVDYYSSPIPWQKTTLYTNVSGGENNATIYRYYPDEENAAWEYYGENSTNFSSVGFVWTSHDIQNYNSTTIADYASPAPVPETTTGIVPTPVEREENYTISGDTLNELIGAAQAITGTTEPMTPEQAIEILNQYAEQSADGEDTTE